MPEKDRIADKIVKSISEDPHVEPGQADTTPANETDRERAEDQPNEDQPEEDKKSSSN